ncbi:MAG: hypothetical protein HQ522_12575 [Bacteroidetes bacterium]|nr:hypothetical protein [Bacteroidota bacterium]
MNLRILFLIVLLFFFSCEKGEISYPGIYSPQINFEISESLLPGTSVKLIEFIDGEYYYSVGKEIFYTKRSGQTSSFEADSDVLSMAFNEKDKSLYFGTYSSGLGKYDGSKTRYYTIENSGLPRNLIRQVECDESGNIWFNSSASKIGGLSKYDGERFTHYLPSNSQLPDNLIYCMQILNGKIYILSKGIETARVGIEINGNHWKELFVSGGCFPTDMALGSTGSIFYIEDSREYCGGGLFPDEVLFEFVNEQKTIHREHEAFNDLLYILSTDKRDYVWVAKFSSDLYEILTVFDGENWHEAPKKFPDDFINCIEVDDENNVWIGTNNGIYVLNQ